MSQGKMKLDFQHGTERQVNKTKYLTVPFCAKKEG